MTARPIAEAQPTPLAIPVCYGFDYPIGKSGRVTQGKDGDGWYNAQDFGENKHLGEDWNAETGGNTDCGSPVHAAARGLIIFAGEAGPGWGKVVIVRHQLPDGTQVETLYAHLQSILKSGGEVNRREQIGNIGDGGGAYLCHLHFELRFNDCPAWGATGVGYGEDQTGWTDPSRFIDAHRPLSKPKQ